MNIKLSQNAHGILKHVLTFTGEKEMNVEGKEVLSPRRLNGEEGSQRRFYFAKIDGPLNKATEERNKLATEVIAKYKKENKQKDKETEEDYNARITNGLNSNGELLAKVNAPLMKPIEVELEEKTIEVLKKYFKIYEDVNGWTTADDASIVEIETILK